MPGRQISVPRVQGPSKNEGCLEGAVICCGDGDPACWEAQAGLRGGGKQGQVPLPAYPSSAGPRWQRGERGRGRKAEGKASLGGVQA